MSGSTFDAFCRNAFDLLDGAGIARRHGSTLDIGYVRRALDPICDLAQDMRALHRLDRVLKKAAT